MGKRIKKPPIRPEVRRDWLRRNEESGESPPQIATQDKYDVRTVRKQIDLAKQEREVREARLQVLREAMQNHYNDLLKFTEKLNSEIAGLGDIPSSPDDDLIESALRQHLPRSPIWSYITKRQNLQKKAEEQQKILESVIMEIVKADHRMTPTVNASLDGIINGIVVVLIAEVKQWAQGNSGYSLKDSLVMEPAGEGVVNPRFGFSHMGVMADEQAKEYVKTIQQVIDDIEIKLRHQEEYLDLERTFAELGRLNSKFREELAVIRLKRIVPGRCKYCPL